MSKQIIALVVTLLVGAVIGVLLIGALSNQPSPQSQPQSTLPTDSSTPPSDDGQQEVDADYSTAAFVNEVRSKHPEAMFGENGYVILMMVVKNIDTTTGWCSLGIYIWNWSSSFIHTNPNYLTIVDSKGTAYKYHSSTYSKWGSAAFEGITLPPRTDSGLKFITFKMSPNAVPARVIYRDAATPVFAVDWVQP